MGTRFMLSRWPGRIRTAGMLIGAVLLLGACTARGGGQIDEPLPGGPLAIYQGQATFGFTFTCEMKGKKALISGQIAYHDSAPSTSGTTAYPAISLHGVVDPFFVENVSSCDAAAQMFPSSALFQGTYRPQKMNPAVPGNLERGRFTVQVFDQGEPGGSMGDITGDAFSIELVGGTYALYTRGGYIEGGNVQVRP